MNALSKLFSIGLASSFIAVSCVDDSVLSQKENAQLQVKTCVSSVGKATRNIVEGTQLGLNDEIGISIYNNDDGLVYNGNSAFENVLYTHGGSGYGNWSSTTPITLTQRVGKAFAYYPYDGSADISAINMSTYYQEDFMCSDCVDNISLNSPGAIFHMNHLQSAFEIWVDDGGYGRGVIRKITLSSNGLSTRAVLNAKTGKVSNYSGIGNTEYITPYAYVGDYSPEGTIMMFPCSGLAHDFNLSIELDNKTYNVNIPMKTAFQEGKIYEVHLTAKAGETPFGGNGHDIIVNVKPWVDGGSLGDVVLPGN